MTRLLYREIAIMCYTAYMWELWKKMAVLGVIAGVVILLLLNFTSPENNPFGVLVFFTALYVIMVNLVLWVVKTTLKLMGRKGYLTRVYYLLSAVWAFAPVMLVFLISLETYSLLIVGVVILLELLLSFAVIKGA